MEDCVINHCWCLQVPPTFGCRRMVQFPPPPFFCVCVCVLVFLNRPVVEMSNCSQYGTYSIIRSSEDSTAYHHVIKGFCRLQSPEAGVPEACTTARCSPIQLSGTCWGSPAVGALLCLWSGCLVLHWLARHRRSGWKPEAAAPFSPSCTLPWQCSLQAQTLPSLHSHKEHQWSQLSAVVCFHDGVWSACW